MGIKAWIPNLFTLGNLVCGCFAIHFAQNQSFEIASLLVFGGAVFDFADGFVARLLKVSSELGKQLDSLSDVVTFGVAPGMIMLHYMNLVFQLKAEPWIPLATEEDHTILNLLTYVAFLIPVFSAVRLAVFNLDTEQSDAFKGLPTPANGMFFSFLPLLTFGYSFDSSVSNVMLADLIRGVSSDVILFLINPAFLVGLILVFCVLMVSRIRLFALKFKTFGWRGNEIRYLFLTCALVLLIIFLFRSIPLIVLLYLLMSFMANALKLK